MLTLQIIQQSDFTTLRKHAKSTLHNLKSTEICNQHNGIKARLSSNGIDKLLSSQAVNKSLANGFSKEAHFVSVEHIDEIFSISILAQSEPPRNKSQDILAWHKYIATYSIDSEVLRAKITLKETISNQHRIYSLELLELLAEGESSTP